MIYKCLTLIMFLRSTCRRFSPSGRMIKSPLLSLIPVKKKITQMSRKLLRVMLQRIGWNPTNTSICYLNFLSWQWFSFNFLVKKGCKCDWIFGSLYRAQLMNIALNDIAFITWVYLIFSSNAYFITKINQFEKKKKAKGKERNKLIKKDTFVIYSEFFLPVKVGSSWFLLDTL